jgi:hypothetical protein
MINIVVCYSIGIKLQQILESTSALEFSANKIPSNLHTVKLLNPEKKTINK